MTLQFACERFAEVDEVAGDACLCGEDLPEELITDALDMASDIMVLLTNGRIHGRCEQTVRPVVTGWSCAPRDGEFLGLFPSARFGGMDTIPLPGVNPSVEEVVIDGVVLAPAEYGLIDNRYLFRRGGTWPSNRDLTLLPGAAGVFELTIKFGYAIDFITSQAAIELTCELLKGFSGTESHLPAGTVSANIQGAAVKISEALDEGGRTGLERLQRFYNVYARDGEGQSDVWTPELSHGWQLVEVEGPSGS